MCARKGPLPPYMSRGLARTDYASYCTFYSHYTVQCTVALQYARRAASYDCPCHWRFWFQRCMDCMGLPRGRTRRPWHCTLGEEGRAYSRPLQEPQRPLPVRDCARHLTGTHALPIFLYEGSGPWVSDLPLCSAKLLLAFSTILSISSCMSRVALHYTSARDTPSDRLCV